MILPTVKDSFDRVQGCYSLESQGKSWFFEDFLESQGKSWKVRDLFFQVRVGHGKSGKFLFAFKIRQSRVLPQSKMRNFPGVLPPSPHQGSALDPLGQ